MSNGCYVSYQTIAMSQIEEVLPSSIHTVDERQVIHFASMIGSNFQPKENEERLQTTRRDEDRSYISLTSYSPDEQWNQMNNRIKYLVALLGLRTNPMENQL